MKITDESEKYVKYRLEIWGEWYSRGCDSGLGYSRKNIIARLCEEGGVLINGTGHKKLPTNVEAEEIEEIVKEIFQKQRDQAIVLQIRYFHPEEHEFAARRNGYTKTQYYSHLKLAHKWIEGYLSAIRKLNKS
jgi:hypothetical protein